MKTLCLLLVLIAWCMAATAQNKETGLKQKSTKAMELRANSRDQMCRRTDALKQNIIQTRQFKPMDKTQNLHRMNNAKGLKHQRFERPINPEKGIQRNKNEMRDIHEMKGNRKH